MKLAVIVLSFLLCYVSCRTIQFYIEPTQKTNPTYVQQLVEGTISRVEQGMNLTSSVSLVYDSGHYIVVDSPSATDIQSKEIMLKGIISRNVAPGEVQFVVTTHGHPDHFGQGNFFPNARHFFGSYEYSDTMFISTELNTNDVMQLTKNVQLWNTPGHTAQDVTVMVHNVSCCGIVAVSGDLFYHEDDANEDAGMWFQEAWNPIIGKISRNKVLCYANYVIPGHGKLFKVTEAMKKKSECYSKITDSDNIQPLELKVATNSPVTKITKKPFPIINIKIESTTTAPAYRTTEFYTVDLAAETPSPEFDFLQQIQENLPPLGQKLKSNVEYPLQDQDVSNMVKTISDKVSTIFDPRNDSIAPEVLPKLRKWRSTLHKLWNKYVYSV